MNEADFHIADAYLHGDLSAEDAAEFQRRLKADEALATSFEAVREAYLAVELAGFIDIRDRVKKIGKSLEKSPSTPPPRRMAGILIAIAVIIIIAIAAFVFWPRQKSTPADTSDIGAIHQPATHIHSPFLYPHGYYQK